MIIPPLVLIAGLGLAIITKLVVKHTSSPYLQQQLEDKPHAFVFYSFGAFAAISFDTYGALVGFCILVTELLVLVALIVRMQRSWASSDS
jgi:hypothetical protein